MAVDFNPQIQEIGSSMAGYSQGTGPDRTFEALFEGLSQTGMNVVQNMDAQTQENIRADVETGFQQTNDEFGYTPPPEGMQGELDRIVSLQNALEQGKISQVNYYGRLATLSKQLRTKYPRYERIVDSTIQEVTGTRPANAYRDALISEMQSLQEGQNAAGRERRSWESQNSGIITAIFGEDYWANPDAYSLPQVQSKVGRWKADNESIDSNLKQLQYQATLGNVNAERAGTEADRMFGTVVTSSLNRVANGAGFNQMVSDFISSGGEGLDEFTVELTQSENHIRTQLMETAQREFVQTGLLSMEEVNKRIDQALAPIKAVKEQMLGGNFEFATRMVTINNDVAERSLNDIYRRYPEAQVGAGISKMNPYAGSEWMTRIQPGQTDSLLDRITNIAVDVTGNAASGSAGGVMKDVLTSGDQQVSRATIETFFNVIKDQNAPQDHVSNLVEELFGTNVDFMSSDVVAAEDLEQIYTKFLAPEVTAAIVAKGTPEDLRKYTDWAFEKFRALPNVRAAAGNLNNFLGAFDAENLTASYDPTTNRMEIRIPEGSAAFDPKYAPPGSRRRVQELVGTFNRALSVLDPIAKANGVEMGDMVNELVRELNKVEEGASENGVFGWLANQFSMSANASEMPKGEVISGIEAPDTDLDFLFGERSAVSAYSSGDLDATDFLDPRSNPAVEPSVLARFDGRRLPAAIRLNNMGAVSIVGNVDNSWAARQPGFVGAVPRPKNEGGYYAQYATPEHGVAAASRLLERYGSQGVNTPNSITRKWAAEPGNYPNVLVKYLNEAGFNVDRNTRLDLSNPDVRKAILRAKSAHESGAGRPVYAEAVFARGVTM